MISFYKGTKQITGSAGQLWYSTSERGVFVEMLKQHGWDQSKGPNGVGTFKESKLDPKKRILMKLTIEEMSAIIDVIEDNKGISVANQLIVKNNEMATSLNNNTLASVTAFNTQVVSNNSFITTANIDLKARGETPLLKYLVAPAPVPVPLQTPLEFKKFETIHKTQKNTTHVGFLPWEKDQSRYVFKMTKKDNQNTTDSGSVSISLLLRPNDVRVLKEYLTVGLRDILIYRPIEGSDKETGKKVNKPAEDNSLSIEEHSSEGEQA